MILNPETMHVRSKCDCLFDNVFMELIPGELCNTKGAMERSFETLCTLDYCTHRDKYDNTYRHYHFGDLWDLKLEDSQMDPNPN